MKKILTVSVAAYNLGGMIRENLDSFVQSGVLDDLQIIVTDDGSRDSTPEIVEEYCKKYPHSIFLVRQPNAGPGSTVNCGIEHAAGKYFRMVDGDDWVDPKALKSLVTVLRKTDVDMVLSPYTMVDDKTGEKREVALDLPSFGRKISFEKVAFLDLAMHNAIYKTSILQENGIRLSSGFYTDMQYLVFPSVYVKSVLPLKNSLYQYRVSLDGQSMSYPSMQKNIKQHEAVLFSLIELYESYRNSENPDAAHLAFLRQRAVKMSGTHMAILLSFPPEKTRKMNFYAFRHLLSEKSEDIYEDFCRFRTARVLNAPFTYQAVSFLHRRKNGIR